MNLQKPIFFGKRIKKSKCSKNTYTKGEIVFSGEIEHLGIGTRQTKL